MKKTIFLVFLLSFGLQNYAFSQRISILGGDLHVFFGPVFNNWTSTPQHVEVDPIGNIGLDIGAMQDFRIIKTDLMLSAGLALSSVNLATNYAEFLNWVVLDNPAISAKIENQKIVLNYLEVPLEFVFKPGENKEKSFVIALGGRAGFLVDGKIKIKTDGTKFKMKDRSPYEPLRLGLTARVGKGWINLYGRYDLTSPFKPVTTVPVEPFDQPLYSIGLLGIF